MSDDALLARIHAELEADHVYVDPALADQFSADELAAIEAGAAKHDVYVVAYPFQSRDQFGGEADDLVARLHDAYGGDGLYLSNYALSYDGSTPYLRSVEYGFVEEDTWAETSIVHDEEPADLGAAYERFFELLDLPESTISELEDASYADNEPDGNGLGEAVDGIPGWVWPALLVPVLSAVAWRWLVTRRRLAPVAVLPPSAIDRIRAAHDTRLLAQAREDLLLLGEEIDAAELAPGADAVAWQAALDHYDAGQRLVDADREGRPEVLDVVGAVVLARRGRSALAAATDGRAWTPARPCFLNPLHGDATGSRKLEYAGTTVEAPLCGRCRQQLDRKQAPDTLDVARSGKPLHYFETDLEPWATTGYGALHDDLISRLHARG